MGGLLRMIYYIPITILLSAIEAWRIKRSWGAVKNINHWLTYLMALAGMAGLYFIVKPAGWHVVTFATGCIAIRGLLFDIFLNLFRREKLDYTSNASNSLNEDRLTKIPFWWRRFGFAGLMLFVLIINYFL